jgi:hypothetical protein
VKADRGGIAGIGTEMTIFSFRNWFLNRQILAQFTADFIHVFAEIRLSGREK